VDAELLAKQMVQLMSLYSFSDISFTIPPDGLIITAISPKKRLTWRIMVTTEPTPKLSVFYVDSVSAKLARPVSDLPSVNIEQAVLTSPIIAEILEL
jgi:hypothetical protein